MASCNGCRSSHTGPDPVEARKLTVQALEPKSSESEAIVLLRKALDADPFSPAAHNDLGVLLMRQADYYNAAKEFEQAGKLAPSNPEPRVNLGLLYENVNRLRDAAEQYEQALVLSPQYLPAQQSLARVRIRTDQRDSKTIELLHIVATRSPEARWRDWAQGRLTKLVPGELPTTQRAPVTVPDFLQDHIVIPAK